MFDYCGEIEATLSEYQALLEKIIKEVFPTADVTVKIRKTKAMRDPKISISIADGPIPQDFVDAIPMLSECERGTWWAYRGKVLPGLGYRVAEKSNSAQIHHKRVLSDEIKREGSIQYLVETAKGVYIHNPMFKVEFIKRFRDACRLRHPLQKSATLLEMDHGDASMIEEIAIQQRRSYLERATPPARGGEQRRNRL